MVFPRQTARRTPQTARRHDPDDTDEDDDDVVILEPPEKRSRRDVEQELFAAAEDYLSVLLETEPVSRNFKSVFLKISGEGAVNWTGTAETVLGDVETCAAVGKAFSLHEIRTTIFKHLPVQSLLKCSEVNQTWYEETRRILKEEKRCPAVIGSKGQPCLELLNLNNEIPWMTHVPFNGLHIKLNNHEPCLDGGLSSGRQNLRQFFGNIINLPQLTSVTIDWSLDVCSFHKCFVCNFVVELTRGICFNLKEIIMHNMPDLERTYRREFQGALLFDVPGTLLKLETFRASSLTHCRRFVERLLKAAPNLASLYVSLVVDHLVEDETSSLTAEELGKLRWLTVRPSEATKSRIFQLADSQLKLQILHLRGSKEPPENWASALKLLFQSVSSTVEEITTYRNEFVACFTQQLIPFPRLQKLILWIDAMTDQVPRILNRAQLGQTFPKLKNLRVIHRQLSSNQTLEQYGNDFHEDEEDTGDWPEIERLDFTTDSSRGFSYTIFECFANKCRNIVEFCYKAKGEKLLNYQIFTCFPRLKRLELDMSMRNQFNMDDLMCGLDPAEAAELHAQHVLTLKAMNIVPRRHCLSNLRELEELKIKVRGAEQAFKGIIIPSRLLLSSVTGVLAFSRNPSLNVGIECHMYGHSLAMQTARPLIHMSLFANVSYVR